MVSVSAPKRPTTPFASPRRRSSIALYAEYPHGLIGTSGPDVGLPPGTDGQQRGRSPQLRRRSHRADGHLRIDIAVADGTLGKNPAHPERHRNGEGAGGRLHLLGLVSDGGVHSSHRASLRAHRHRPGAGVPVVVHAFLDGRDTPPGTAPGYLGCSSSSLAGKGVIGTVSGRYWAMDRDNRWERVETGVPRDRDGGRSAKRVVRSRAIASIVRGRQDGRVRRAVRRRRLRGRRRRQGHRASTSTSVRTARASSRGAPDRGLHAVSRVGGQAAPFRAYACMTTYDTKLALADRFPEGDVPGHLPGDHRPPRTDAVSLRRDREVRARHVLLQRRARGAFRRRGAADDPVAEGRDDVRRKAAR